MLGGFLLGCRRVWLFALVDTSYFGRLVEVFSTGGLIWRSSWAQYPWLLLRICGYFLDLYGLWGLVSQCPLLISSISCVFGKASLISAVAKLKTSACTSVVVERKVSHVVPLFSLFFDRSTSFSGERRLFSEKLFYEFWPYAIVARQFALWFVGVELRFSKQNGCFWVYWDLSPGAACPSLPALPTGSRLVLLRRPSWEPLFVMVSKVWEDSSDKLNPNILSLCLCAIF